MRKTNRFIVKSNLDKPTVVVGGEAAHQMRKVLYLQIGESVILPDGHGKEVVAEITDFIQDSVELRLGVVNEIKLSGRQVVLYCAILKHDNFEWAVQKATEVGVTSIIPIITERTIKTGLKYERLKKIIQESCEQCQRGVMPELHEIVRFEDAIKTAEGTKIIFEFDGEKLSNIKSDNAISIFVGPEGGWTQSEIKQAREAGFVVASLGDYILRGETAAVVGSWMVVNGNL